ncbi:MAG: potassium transporter TrkG, partial [Victivallaceae bacterium]
FFFYTTAFMMIFGSFFFWLFQALDDRPISWLDAFFQSATARTAGFNSIPLKELTGSSVILMIILMQIGASPGSTGGGIKTTTVALAAAAIFNTFLGNQRVLAFKREIPPGNVLKAFALIVTYIFLNCVGALMLESLTPCTTEWAFFESVSALSTVGLALDNREPMTAAAKIFLVFYMFLGRVGLFTFFLFLLGRERQSRLIYPSERVIVS